MPDKRRLKSPRPSRPHMPGYGILGPAKGRGLLPWDWARKKFSKARNYMVGTTKPDGSPHLMPVWGVLIDDVFYFSTGKDSRKARNLQSNPKCTVGVAGQDNEEAVILEGYVQKASGKAILKSFKDVYQAKYKFDMSTFNEPFYAVLPSVAFAFSAYGDFPGTATRWVFGHSQGARR